MKDLLCLNYDCRFNENERCTEELYKECKRWQEDLIEESEAHKREVI